MSELTKVDVLEIVEGAVDRLMVAIEDLAQTTDARFNAVDERFDAMDLRFDSLETKFKQVSRVVRRHSADITELKTQTS